MFASFDLGAKDGYRRFLSAHADAVLPIEAALDAAQAGEVIADWDMRRRGEALRADLAALGTPVLSGDEPAAIAGFDDADTKPFAIAGAIYVLEGSRLGGRFLARQVGEDLPREYLDPNQAPKHWRELLARLDVILDRPEKQAVALDAARSVFATFHTAGSNWLSKE